MADVPRIDVDGSVTSVAPASDEPTLFRVEAGGHLLDGVTTAAKFIDYAHHEVHSGSAYTVSDTVLHSLTQSLFFR